MGTVQMMSQKLSTVKAEENTGDKMYVVDTGQPNKTHPFRFLQL